MKVLETIQSIFSLYLGLAIFGKMFESSKFFFTVVSSMVKLAFQPPCIICAS